ncbi:uncharacterized protein B0P05DRAFT_557862 [Gilbertella persicaria]|uniref:uncharacterized protein n=1 Tax=Gilbertella persicaria TaxID=101096 RepID=UPI0022207EB1|nr:uncharacterized protein B0P05DRAFT_557862 [Gilbertella persicaria]KAI8060374.1 hypothetical protein B0P05DRAFT_557862 [Gilbertella persicaria]
MANASSKKVATKNKQTLVNLQKGIMAINAVYVLWRIIYHWSTFTFGQCLLYVTTAGISMLLYRVLLSSGTPEYSADGTLIRSGDDLAAEGLTAYMFDIIYITWFVHLTTAFISNKFWYTYIVIPGYAAYKLVPIAMGYLSQKKPSEQESNTGKSKRQMKLEKRASKGQHVKYC